MRISLWRLTDWWAEAVLREFRLFWVFSRACWGDVLVFVVFIDGHCPSSWQQIESINSFCDLMSSDVSLMLPALLFGCTQFFSLLSLPPPFCSTPFTPPPWSLGSLPFNPSPPCLPWPRCPRALWGSGNVSPSAGPAGARGATSCRRRKRAILKHNPQTLHLHTLQHRHEFLFTLLLSLWKPADRTISS